MSISDKLQTLIKGKRYVLNKLNERANTFLSMDSSWELIGDAVASIEGGSSTPVINNQVFLYDEQGNRSELYAHDEQGNRYVIVFKEVE